MLEWISWIVSIILTGIIIAQKAKVYHKKLCSEHEHKEQIEYEKKKQQEKERNKLYEEQAEKYNNAYKQWDNEFLYLHKKHGKIIYRKSQDWAYRIYLERPSRYEGWWEGEVLVHITSVDIWFSVKTKRSVINQVALINFSDILKIANRTKNIIIINYLDKIITEKQDVQKDKPNETF